MPGDRQRLAIGFRRDQLAKQLGEVPLRLEAFASRAEVLMLCHRPGQAKSLAQAFRRSFIYPQA